ncbi:MAG: MBL fold metallo-hydrolase [Thermoleophilia bacterium]|nr:MBL fold metallo-hydrolase [Thermoleophilia bacterium]
MQANCHFVYDPGPGSGIIIDPGGDHEQILEVVKTSGAELAGILLTHGHADHLGGAAEVARATGAAIYGTSEARETLADPQRHVLFPGMPGFEPAAMDHVIHGDEDLNIGAMSVTAVTTPGHTPGSVTFYVMGSLFCGDLLFRGSIGRTDLPGGSLEELEASVRKLIEAYPPDTAVYPGHGSSTTLGRERETNPFLTGLA